MKTTKQKVKLAGRALGLSARKSLAVAQIFPKNCVAAAPIHFDLDGWVGVYRLENSKTHPVWAG